MTFLQKKNNAISKIATVGGIDATTNPITFSVTTGEGSKFPSSNFKVTIDNEILLCTSRTGDSFTCSRAQEGTTAAAHSQNADIELRITAGTLAEYEDISKLHLLDYAPDGGSTDDYSIALSPAPAAYYEGMLVKFKANTSNTGAATLNVNGLGAKDLLKISGGQITYLTTGDILGGQIVIAFYDGANRFIVLSPLASSGNVASGLEMNNDVSAKAKLSNGTLVDLLKISTTNFMNIGNASIAGFWLPAAFGLVQSKAGTFTKDMATTTDVAITGIGFKPSMILIFASSGTDAAASSLGLSDSSRGAAFYRCQQGGTWTAGGSYIVSLRPGGADIFSMTVKSYDADGFTLAVDRLNNPTGTAQMAYIAIK